MKISEVAKDYDRIYSTHGLRANRAYYRWIISLLGVKKGKFLDIACGEGILLKEVKKSKPDVHTSGFDISPEACKIASKNTPGSAILVGDGDKIPFQDKTFDYVTCLGSLEHFIDPDVGAKEIVRVLKDTGVACIVLPNSLGKDNSQFQIIERTATKNEWIELLEKNGLQVQKIYKSNLWPELFQEGTFKLKSIRKFIRRVLIKYLCPLNLAREFVFICSNKGGRRTFIDSKN